VSEPAITVAGLEKRFRIWRKPSDVLLEAVTGRQRHIDFQALSDVSFEVKRGSVVGIMGRNGAGKSTLLRIIAGTLDASSGSVVTRGRISAILELGTGFHPAYTGRENIFLGGLCLGMSRDEVAGRVDEIISFAELGEFIDRPFRTYSSGMQSRLTFAVATSVEPDILIVDEALAVGDARFSLKSFDRIQQFKREGRSILLVSHDINQVVTFCDHAVLLDRGRVIASGRPTDVGNLYHEHLFGAPRPVPPPPEPVPADLPDTAAVPPVAAAGEPAPVAPAPDETEAERTTQVQPPPSEAPTVVDAAEAEAAAPDPLPLPPPAADERVPALREHRYGDGSVSINAIEIRTPAGVPTTYLRSLDPYEIHCELEASLRVENVVVGVLFRNTRGQDLFGWDSRAIGPQVIPVIEAGERIGVSIRFRNNFAGGTYFLTVALADYDERKHDLRFDALEIVVAPTPHIFTASVVDLEVQPPRLRRLPLAVSSEVV